MLLCQDTLRNSLLYEEPHVSEHDPPEDQLSLHTHKQFAVTKILAASQMTIEMYSGD
jgi:hypothetical protein